MIIKLLQAAALFTLLLTAGCQKIDQNLLGGSYNSQTAIDQEIENLQF